MSEGRGVKMQSKPVKEMKEFYGFEKPVTNQYYTHTDDSAREAIDNMREDGLSKREIAEQLMQDYNLSEEDAIQMLRDYIRGDL